MINSLQLTLLSNVKGNARNKPYDFESTLAHPLELDGEWEVALTDLSYPEQWNHTGQKLEFAAALIGPTQNNPMHHNLNLLESTLEQDLRNAYPESSFAIQSFQIYSGDHQLFTEFIKCIQIMIRNALQADIDFSYRPLTKTLRITSTQHKIALAAWRKDSLFDLLGMSNARGVERNELGIQVFVLDKHEPIYGYNPIWKIPDSSLFVHCDCIQLSPVDNRVVPLLAQIPCKRGTNFWHSSPPYYVRLTSHFLEHLRIWFSTESGEQMSETDEQVVVCVLNLRRRRFH